MRDWSKEFNALPKEVRTIASAMEARTRIQHLKMEKERLKKRYRQSLNEINYHLKSCADWLLRLEDERRIELREGGHS